MKRIISIALVLLTICTSVVPCFAIPISEPLESFDFIASPALQELRENESVEILSCYIVSEDEEFTCIEVAYETSSEDPFETGTTGCTVRHIWTKNGTEILYLDFIPWFIYDKGISAEFDVSTFEVYIQVAGASCAKTSLTYKNTTSPSKRAQVTQNYVLADANGNVRYGSATAYCDVYGKCEMNGGVFLF